VEILILNLEEIKRFVEADRDHKSDTGITQMYLHGDIVLTSKKNELTQRQLYVYSCCKIPSFAQGDNAQCLMIQYDLAGHYGAQASAPNDDRSIRMRLELTDADSKKHQIVFRTRVRECKSRSKETNLMSEERLHA
jgi:hypothetical protein